MKTAKKIALYQLGFAIFAALMWAIAVDIWSGLAGFTGGAINAGVTLYVGWLNFGGGHTDPNQILMTFYRAEARKIALSAVLFGAAVMLFGKQLLPLATTFSASFLVYWFALLWNDDV